MSAVDGISPSPPRLRIPLKLFLVRPPDAMVSLAQGLLSLAQLQERLIGAAVEAGWISEREYTHTRPVTADLLLDARALPAALPEDPEALLGALRAFARTPIQTGAAPAAD